MTPAEFATLISYDDAITNAVAEHIDDEPMCCDETAFERLVELVYGAIPPAPDLSAKK